MKIIKCLKTFQSEKEISDKHLTEVSCSMVLIKEDYKQLIRPMFD